MCPYGTEEVTVGIVTGIVEPRDRGDGAAGIHAGDGCRRLTHDAAIRVLTGPGLYGALSPERGLGQRSTRRIVLPNIFSLSEADSSFVSRK